MTIESDWRELTCEIEEYLAAMSSVGRKPSAIYLTKRQETILRKHARHEGREYRGTYAELPVKIWEGHKRPRRRRPPDSLL